MVAATFGISPAALLAGPPEALDALVDIIERQQDDAKAAELRSRLRGL